jgi:hypothetical protein
VLGRHALHLCMGSRFSTQHDPCRQCVGCAYGASPSFGSESHALIGSLGVDRVRQRYLKSMRYSNVGDPSCAPVTPENSCARATISHN